MEKRRTTLDREPLSSEYIKDRQDFSSVLKGFKASQIPLWKSTWFYGSVGLAAVAAVLSITNLLHNTKKHDLKSTPLQVATYNVDQDSPPASDENNAVLERSQETDPSVHAIKESDPPDVPEKEVSRTVAPESKAEDHVDQLVVAEDRPDEPVHRVSEPVNPEPVYPKKTMATLVGVVDGPVFVGSLCASDGIECNDGSTVLSYTIQYNNGMGEDAIETIRGRQISSYMCDKIRRYNVNQEILITRIIVETPDGSRKMVPSIRIVPTY